MPKNASQKMQGEKSSGKPKGDFIDIKNDLVCKSRDRLKPKSAICFLPVSLDPGERYSCCANISNLRQHLWHMLAASLPAKESKSSSTKWTKFSRVQRLFATPNGRKSKQEYSPSLLKIQGTGLCSCGLLYCSTVRLLSRNRISSQWTRHYCFWQPLFLVFPLYFSRYTDPNVPQPNLFSFSNSFHSNFGNSGSFLPFLPLSGSFFAFFASGSVIIGEYSPRLRLGEYSPIITSPSANNC